MVQTIKKVLRYLFALPQEPTAELKVGHQITAPIAVIIPSHRPDNYTGKLVRDLLRFNKNLNLQIIIVNDCAPAEFRPYFDTFAAYDAERVTVLSTPKNSLKAGAINYGLRHIKKNRIPAEIVFTMDDDVIIRSGTIKAMAKRLLANPHFGAVCSLAQVKNKNKSLLTRMQGLEYSQFNTIRIADNGYLNGPLVMHGMATAFRYEALKEVKGFTLNHLVEDYDITARIKDAGWHVALAPNARAYTVVPESINQLWRQRARWNTGGVQIVLSRHKIEAVLQDFLGHVLFILNAVLILVSLMIHTNATPQEGSVRTILLAIAILLFLIGYIFSISLLQYYPDRDWKDIALRALVLPELFYSLFLTLILLGTYLFFVNRAVKRVGFRSRVDWVTPLDQVLNKLGYSQKWGTV